MKSFKTLLTTVFIISLIGCLPAQRSGRSADETVVARINKYAMTAADFKENSRNLMVVSQYYYGETPNSRKRVIDDLITKQILLQEAQKLDLDKDMAFLREIQSYWEQALIKSLIKIKSDELLRYVKVDDEQCRKEYELMKADDPDIGPFEVMASGIKEALLKKRKEEAFGQWLADIRAKADVYVDTKLLDEIVMK